MKTWFISVVVFAACLVGVSETHVEGLENRPLPVGGITNSDYLDIVKLFTPIALKLDEVQRARAADLTIGIRIGPDEIKATQSLINEVDPACIINPPYRMTTESIWDPASKKPLCLLTLSVVSIESPFAIAHVYLQKNLTEDGTRIVSLYAIKTRSGWRQAERSELKDQGEDRRSGMIQKRK